MKIHHRIIDTIIGISIVVALLSPITSFAGELFKVPFSPVYQATQNSTLKDALTQVSQRSGIVFKINT